MRAGAEEVGIALTLVRRLRGWSQREMCAVSGIHTSALCAYEAGKVLPMHNTLRRLVEAARIPMWVFETLLLPTIRLAWETARSNAQAPTPSDPADDLWHEASSALTRLGKGRLRAAVAAPGLTSAIPPLQPQPAAGEDPWALLPVWAQPPPLATADLAADFARFVARVCAESKRISSDDSARAIGLARVAQHIAELAPADCAHRCQGYAQAFLADALRVAGDLPAAEATLQAAWHLWRLAELHNDSGVLGEWRLLDIEASLRRAQDRFSEALQLHAKTLASAPADMQGRVLLQQAATLEKAGKLEAAMRTLRQALPLVDGGSEPRDRLVLRFNCIVLLSKMRRYKEAAGSLAELHSLALALGVADDLTRLRWLSARVAAGLGQAGEAIDGFAEVLAEYRRRGNGLDAAQVALELAGLYLDQGSTGDVQALVEQIAWIADAPGVQQEVLATLAVFTQAVNGGAASAGLADRLGDYIQRGCKDPHPADRALLSSHKLKTKRRRRAPARA
jgi:transcriptional regulator with XRE-family HTH domain/tetratricopeptide (TPR) repeat protein